MDMVIFVQGNTVKRKYFNYEIKSLFLMCYGNHDENKEGNNNCAGRMVMIIITNNPMVQSLALLSNLYK
jgi:hypothetical protein